MVDAAKAKGGKGGAKKEDGKAKSEPKPKKEEAKPKKDDAEAKAKQEAEAKAKKEKEEAEAKAKKEKEEAEAKAKAEAEAAAAAAAAAKSKKEAPKKAADKEEEEEEGEGDDDDDDDDDMPALEDPENAAGGKQNRSEKKARKAITKLGVKPVPGIVRVTVKKAKNILFVISKPDVFKSTGSETYIIFGEAKIEDINSQAQAVAAEQFKAPEAGAAAKAAEPETSAEGEVDESGLDPAEIETVVMQSGATRARAVKALRKTGSIVDAILELTP